MAPMPRGGMKYDWQEWSLIYRRRLRKLVRLICAEGYAVEYDGDGMPVRVIKNTENSRLTIGGEGEPDDR